MSTALRVVGDVGTELALTFAELVGWAEQIDDVSVLVPGRSGAAVRLASVLNVAGAAASATHVTLTSGDGRFSASVPIEAVLEGLVVYRLGAEPLPVSLGGPVRFLIPNVERCAIGGVDACANVKGLAEVRVSMIPGKDTRPLSDLEHAELHRHESSRSTSNKTGR